MTDHPTNTTQRLQTLRRQAIESAARATRRGPWWYNTGGIITRPTPTSDVNDLTASHRCTADRPPILEDRWLRYGLIVDADGTRYLDNGQPVEPLYPTTGGDFTQ